MDLKSIFHREKPVQSPGLPKPPSIREMIEDIESSSKHDPVILFANRLQRKDPRRSSVDENIAEALKTNSAIGNSSVRKNSDSDSVSIPSTPTPQDVLSQPNFPEVNEHSGGINDSEADSLDPTESIYYKLRQFISLSEQTQETTADVDSMLKMFEKDNLEFLNILGSSQSSTSGKK